MGIRFGRTGGIAVLAALVAIAVSACAGSGSDNAGAGSPPSAQALLRNTFRGNDQISSGVLSLRATITPHGSTRSGTPITISFGGPFDHAGSADGGEVDLTLALSAGGQRLSFGVLMTATAGYLRFDANWYRLPAAQFAQLRRSLRSSGGSTPLPVISIDPLRWLSDPRIVGGANVDGVRTTELRARIDVGALVDDIGKLLAKQAANPALRQSGLPTTITPTERRQLIAALKQPSLELFVGNRDRVLRRAAFDLNVHVPAGSSSQLGGISSVGVAVTLDYAQVDRPQTITAPAHAKPYGQLRQQLLGLGQQLQGSIGGSGGAGSSGAPRTGAAASTTTRYDRCLSRSGGVVSKLQKCASLINR